MSLIIYLSLIPVFMYLLVRFVQIERGEENSRHSKYDDSFVAALLWPGFLFLFLAIIALMLAVLAYGIVHLIAVFLFKSLGLTSLFYGIFDKIPQSYDEDLKININDEGDIDDK